MFIIECVCFSVYDSSLCMCLIMLHNKALRIAKHVCLQLITPKKLHMCYGITMVYAIMCMCVYVHVCVGVCLSGEAGKTCLSVAFFRGCRMISAGFCLRYTCVQCF